MPIKPPDILNRLPSVAELLEKPPIRALAERWNRSVVAGNVRSFLEEMTNDLRRRASDIQLPSVRELAELAARYVVSQQQHSLGAAINATGEFWGDPWRGRPLSDAALERLVAIGREFVAAPDGAPAAKPAFAETICRLTGAEAATATNSYEGAMWLVLSTLAANREVLIARGEFNGVSGKPAASLAASSNVSLREVGTADGATAADYRAAVTSRTAAILRLNHLAGVPATLSQEPILEELVNLARERQMVLVHAMGVAPLDNVAEELAVSLPSVRGTIAAGADLVLVRGDGLISGPSCGLLIGKRDVVERVEQHPLFEALCLDVLRSAALAATVDSFADAERGTAGLPLWQLLTAPVENLRNRAERIAPQLAQAADVAAAEPMELSNRDGSGLGSYGVALTARDGRTNEVDMRLKSSRIPVYGYVEGERIVLNLRTVLPRQDRLLVETIVASPAAATTGQSSL